MRPCRRFVLGAVWLVWSACASAAPTGAPASTLPPVVAEAQTVDRDVQVSVPSGVLKGSMRSAPGGAPLVLILPGSGPTDRDGNNPLGVQAAPYRLLAEALQARGVSTVRADKRGMFASAGGDPNAVTVPDYAADATAWIAQLRADTGAGCVWLLGHSEGALVAEVAAATHPDGLCGVVLVSGPGRRLGDVMREQLEANPANAPILPAALGALDALERGERVDVSKLHPALQGLFNPAVQGFLNSLFSYDPATVLATYEGPVLVVQGTTDLQVSIIDAERLGAARDGVKLVKIDGMNHVWKAAPLDRAANMRTYADPHLPLAPGLADAIAEFVKATR